MANPYIGTVDLNLDGRDYVLRPTIGAQIEFEDRVGKTVDESLRNMATHKFFRKEIIAAVWAGINGEAEYQGDYKGKKSFDIVAALVEKQGIQNGVVLAAIQFLTSAITPPPVEGENKEESDDQKKS